MERIRYIDPSRGMQEVAIVRCWSSRDRYEITFEYDGDQWRVYGDSPEAVYEAFIKRFGSI
jgi:hypothetical protein